MTTTPSACSTSTRAASSASSPTHSASRPARLNLRNNNGGPAVSGEITMHADHLYVQACQPATGHDSGVLYRACQSRKDYTGGRNNFASLDLLNDPALLARTIRAAYRA
jgi:hypothetical protein